jgi:acetolactate synthase-1/2/3 large subunit
MPTKLSDYLIRRVADAGVTHAFLITGGGAMHLNDSIAKEKRLTWICNHHEQGCSIAAEGYARVAGRPALVNVTTGPGGINALNGVFGAYTDSIPMIVVSGQVKRETCQPIRRSPGLRQLGDQEVDIVSMARPVTKWAHIVEDPSTVRWCVEKALHLATSGRPGPVWLDVPSDVQGAPIDEESLRGFDPKTDLGPDELPARAPLEGAALAAACDEILTRIERAERPVFLVGTGVRLAGAQDVFRRVAERLGIPVALTWTAIDQLPNDHPLYAGRAGTIGDRGGNFTVQNSDLVIVVGSRLNIRQVSYIWENFAHHAFKVVVDVDPAELDKPMVRPDMGVVADARAFLEELARRMEARGPHAPNAAHARWLAWCKERVARYPILLDRHQASGPKMNPYRFVHRLFERLADDDVVVCGNATASVVPFQVGRIREGQRMFANSGDASMGFDLPAAIGAAVARGGKRVICLAGDGSLQMNVQELQTASHNRLPIKLFVLDNGGYLSMRSTQGNFFKRFIGEGPSSGVSFPDFGKLAGAHGWPFVAIDEPSWEEGLSRALGTDGPTFVHALLDPEQPFEPKLAARQLPDGRMVSPTLEDLSPFLEREELLSNMLVPLPGS